MDIKAVLFDFGGVLAEEGFREGLKAIARKSRLDPDQFFAVANELIFETGYIIGLSDESSYWDEVRHKTGIVGEDQELRDEILRRFVLRPEMIESVKRLKGSGLMVAVLSDQTNWLEEIDERTPFYRHFHHVFNSYRLKKSKRDPSVFRDVCALMGIRPQETLFVDDNSENVKRAIGEGLRGIHFTGVEEFGKVIRALLGNSQESRKD